MLRPKYPTAPAPTGQTSPLVVPAAVVQSHHGYEVPAACGCQHSPAPATPAAPARRSVRLTPTGALGLVGGGAAAVLVVGTVLVSLLLAVAVTATSVAVCAVVLRSLLTQHRRGR
ncbi:SpdD-like protein [Streptomyces radiopugnans]|uniref:SpdD protein n=1 Tax=Streptomyces radiopugnans TaxID=403935 RepID=A0A1H8ZDI6_9ACTN|nr:SpdD-like protein [Streptomyces radiopugnans]SEP62237.1 hypothetical protein SAMN05216481_101460 [Streptomyces radiopugnans]